MQCIRENYVRLQTQYQMNGPSLHVMDYDLLTKMGKNDDAKEKKEQQQQQQQQQQKTIQRP